MSIIGSGVNLPELSCMAAIKMYKTVVLPRALYGVELWHKITQADLSKLEVAHRFCIKIIQSFPKRTSSLIAESMADCQSIETYIDKKKLMFLGRLCRLRHNRLAKTVLLERMFQREVQSMASIGFVSDACRILSKYSLLPLCRYVYVSNNIS